MQQSSKAKGYFALLITSFVWGTTWIVSKLGVNEIPALQMAYIRQFIAAALFLSFFLLYKKTPLPSGKQMWWLFVMSLLIFVSANGLSTWSIKFIPAGLSSLIGSLYPLSTVIIEKVFFRSRRMTVVTFVGLLLGITGIAIVFYDNSFEHSGTNFLFGVFLSAFAMLSWSVGTIFITRNKSDINPYYGIGWQMLFGSIILFIIAETTQPVVAFRDISATVWLVIAYLILFGSVIAFVAFIYSMKKLPVAVASLYAYINPLVAMVGAYYFLNEKLTIHMLWGAIITLAGVFLVNYSVKRTEKIITEPEI